MSRRTLDVSTLPSIAFGPRATLWWGVVAMLAIEGTALALTGASYLYVRRNFVEWPPAGTIVPALGVATGELVVLLVSLAPMILVDRAARREIAEPGKAPERSGPRPQIASPQRLTVPARLHWMTMVMAVGGAVVGAYFGGSALAASYPEATMAAVVVAFASSGVLGGLAGFAASSFVFVVQQALMEAHAGGDGRKPRAARRPRD